MLHADAGLLARLTQAIATVVPAIVSSTPNRGTAADNTLRKIDLSTSAETSRGAAPGESPSLMQIASAAARSKLPAKTDRRRQGILLVCREEAGVLHSIAAFRLW